MKDLRLAVLHCRILLRRSRAFGMFVAVGVAMVIVTSGITSQATRAAQEQVLESTVMRTIEVDANGTVAPVPLTREWIDQLADLPGVVAVRPWIQSGSLITEAPVPVTLTTALWATPYMQVGQPPIVAGQRENITPLGDDEVILPARVGDMDMTPLLGREVTFEYTQRTSVDTGEARYLELTVIAVFDQAIGGRDGPTAMYVSEATALSMAAAREGVRPEAFGRDIGYPRVIVEARSADQVPDLQRRISDLGFNASSVQSELEHLPPAVRLIEVLGMAVAIVVLMVCLFAGLSIGAGLVAARLREIGLLKAVGFTDTRIARLLGLELGVFGLVAGATGLVVGSISLLICQHLLAGKSVMNVQLAETYSYPGALSMIGITLAPAVAIVAGGILPMLKAATVPPDLAMRDVR